MGPYRRTVACNLVATVKRIVLFFLLFFSRYIFFSLFFLGYICYFGIWIRLKGKQNWKMNIVWFATFLALGICSSLGQNRKIAEPKCTAVADRNWGGGYGGKIVFQASNCYNTSYAAVNAVANVGYFCSDTYKSARCHGKIHWWMQFDRPVNITSVSFEEPPKKENAKYKIWFTNDIGKERETFMAVPAYTANKFSRAFQVEGLYRYLGISSQENCIEYEKGEGDYYWAIQNLKFSVVA